MKPFISVLVLTLVLLQSTQSLAMGRKKPIIVTRESVMDLTREEKEALIDQKTAEVEVAKLELSRAERIVTERGERFTLLNFGRFVSVMMSGYSLFQAYGHRSMAEGFYAMAMSPEKIGPTMRRAYERVVHNKVEELASSVTSGQTFDKEAVLQSLITFVDAGARDENIIPAEFRDAAVELRPLLGEATRTVLDDARAQAATDPHVAMYNQQAQTYFLSAIAAMHAWAIFHYLHNKEDRITLTIQDRIDLQHLLDSLSNDLVILKASLRVGGVDTRGNGRK